MHAHTHPQLEIEERTGRLEASKQNACLLSPAFSATVTAHFKWTSLMEIIICQVDATFALLHTKLILPYSQTHMLYSERDRFIDPPHHRHQRQTHRHTDTQTVISHSQPASSNQLTSLFSVASRGASLAEARMLSMRIAGLVPIR